LNFKQQIAKYVTGHITTSQLPELAIMGIEDGYESESLFILAGMSNGDNGFEIQEYFKKTLAELNLELPDKRNAALQYITGIVQDILNGKKDLIEGLTEIKSNALDSYDFFSETKKYVYDSIGFETIYGLYDTYDDLLNPLCKWDFKKSIETRKSETRTELIVELKKWNEKIKNRVQQRL
jgi:hypothetical protein